MAKGVFQLPWIWLAVRGAFQMRNSSSWPCQAGLAELLDWPQ